MKNTVKYFSLDFSIPINIKNLDNLTKDSRSKTLTLVNLVNF